MPPRRWTLALLLASWRETPAPRSVGRMAARLGMRRDTLKKTLRRHSLSVQQLRALSAMP